MGALTYTLDLSENLSEALEIFIDDQGFIHYSDDPMYILNIKGSFTGLPITNREIVLLKS